MAGTLNPTAAASSPFVFRVSRSDREQGLAAILAILPPGLSAEIASIPACPDSAIAAIPTGEGSAAQQLASPSCPPASRLGFATVAAGAGPDPLYLRGDVHLAGPDRGSPYSLLVIVPALAGPFDLGTLSSRISIDVDPETAQLRLRSDPLPTILSGVPIDLRSVALNLDRPGLIRNPTSCEETSITGTATSAQGATAPISNRFQVGSCAELSFKPTVALRLSGGLGRNAYPQIEVDLVPRAAEATRPCGPCCARVRAKRQSTPPPSPCPPASCSTPAASAPSAPERWRPSAVPASRLGHARLLSPLLPEALQGPIYLRAPSDRYPDLLAELRAGQLHVLLHGRTAAAPGGRLRVRFAGLPDLPLARASITLAGGRDGIFVNSEALCARPRRATVNLSAHNDKQRRLLRPRAAVRCPRSVAGQGNRAAGSPR